MREIEIEQVRNENGFKTELNIGQNRNTNWNNWAMENGH